MTLDPNAKKAAYDAALPALNRDAAPFHVIDLAIEAYLASRPSAIVEEPMAECRLVPVEPTEAMLEAYQGALRRYIEALPPEAKTKGSFGGYWVPAKHKARVRWAAMLAASPALNAALTVEPEAPTGDNHKLDTDRQVFFYEQDFYVLSNFSAFSLKWHGQTFPTSEHAYHWSRFSLGWDLNDADGMDAERIAVRVKEAPSAHLAFKMAQEHRHLQHPDWNTDKVNVMRRILWAKADQHEYVRRKLLATGNRELIEDSWRDDFWGWGPNRDGQNMLGKLWMEVRAELRAGVAP